MAHDLSPMAPLTVAAFIEHALYDPDHGYYSTRAQRSGRDGDFVTSVDAGPIFGETLAVQLIEMLEKTGPDADGRFDLIEVGAGNGRLTRDVLEAFETTAPGLLRRLRVTLVERSAAARESARTLTPRGVSVGTSDRLPARVHGVIFANELLDAFPVHVVENTPEGLREVYLQPREGGTFDQIPGPLSDDRLLEAVAHEALPIGGRTACSLLIPEWLDSAAAALTRGFLLLLDYVHDGSASNTLTTYTRHTQHERWFDAPGTRDITSRVNLPAMRAAAVRAGFDEAGCVDQTYFLIALGILERLPHGPDRESVARRMNAKTLLIPGGLGSTIKVLALAKGIEDRTLRGFSGGRLT